MCWAFTVSSSEKSIRHPRVPTIVIAECEDAWLCAKDAQPVTDELTINHAFSFHFPSERETKL